MILSGTAHNCNILKWFTFFQHRTQLIKIDNASFQPAPISQGVPQGSILSPALFNLHMEPRTIILKQAGISYYLYADDIQLYLKITSTEDLLHLNDSLIKIQTWPTSNHVKLNPKKKELILFTPKGNQSPLQNWLPVLDALNYTQSTSDSVKTLGFTLDKSLSMSNHIQGASNSAFYKLKYLKKIKPFIPLEEDCKTLTTGPFQNRLRQSHHHWSLQIPASTNESHSTCSGKTHHRY